MYFYFRKHQLQSLLTLWWLWVFCLVLWSLDFSFLTLSSHCCSTFRYTNPFDPCYNNHIMCNYYCTQTVYIATEYFPISFWNARVAVRLSLLYWQYLSPYLISQINTLFETLMFTILFSTDAVYWELCRVVLSIWLLLHRWSQTNMDLSPALHSSNACVCHSPILLAL